MMRDTWMLCRSSVVVSALGGDAAVDTLIKDTARWVHGKKLLIVLNHFLVVFSQSLNFINVIDRLIRAVACDLASGMRKHARKLLIVTLIEMIHNKK
jgi:hypothetical protein